MKYLFIILSLSMLISCSDSPVTEQPEPPVKSEYPKQVGTWMVQSEYEADWIGDKSKITQAQGDTVFIDSPQSQFITIWQDTSGKEHLYDQFTFTLVDSSITSNDIKQFSSVNVKLNILFDTKPPHVFSPGGSSLLASEQHVKLDKGVDFDCDNYGSLENGDRIQVELRASEEDSLIRAYQIDALGIVNTVAHIVCGAPLD